MDSLRLLGVEGSGDKYYEGAIYGVALLYNLINNDISRHLEQFDLSPAKFNVLMVIKHQGKEEGISQVEISKKLIVTASNMTRLLDKLEQEKLIYRSAQEGDRRVNLIKVTDRAVKLLDAVWPGYVEKMKEVTSVLTTDEQKIFCDIAAKWVEKVKE